MRPLIRLIVTALKARGHPVYAVLDGWEAPQVIARFPGTRIEALPAAIFPAGRAEGIHTSVYAIAGRTEQ